MVPLDNGKERMVKTPWDTKEIAFSKAADPLAELKARLLQIRKIWGVEIVVLNEELAGEYKLTC